MRFQVVEMVQGYPVGSLMPRVINPQGRYKVIDYKDGSAEDLTGTQLNKILVDIFKSSNTDYKNINIQLGDNVNQFYLLPSSLGKNVDNVYNAIVKASNIDYRIVMQSCVSTLGCRCMINFKLSYLNQLVTLNGHTFGFANYERNSVPPHFSYVYKKGNRVVVGLNVHAGVGGILELALGERDFIYKKQRLSYDSFGKTLIEGV